VNSTGRINTKNADPLRVGEFILRNELVTERYPGL